ncbi:uncharacterized protein BYT42DRAFT_602855 [Radiomyces spectabilis]|uniref:uncharacterized protein n=1 Tax=Radiomyces spectabilis TaxID=64574 RepID=UPI0022200259|nr:uncharacterized protein BYT42DRAFT_602855 [Radiomyces spectabilis]KAI8388298.1 hypothetical protein BYT42DRAFT_602855 [Radiomyces spectabilis]
MSCRLQASAKLSGFFYSRTKKPAAIRWNRDTTYQLASQAQVVRFLNQVYLPHDPLNASLYEARKMTTKQIFHEVLSHTKCSNDKSPTAFQNGVLVEKVHFLQGKVQPKKIKLDKMIRSSVTEICIHGKRVSWQKEISTLIFSIPDHDTYKFPVKRR